eukprot:5233015-Prymnesium_polylepis.2
MACASLTWHATLPNVACSSLTWHAPHLHQQRARLGRAGVGDRLRRLERARRRARRLASTRRRRRRL